MGSKGTEIVNAKLDVDELLKLLNKAYADEWLAYYQYWVGAQIVQGPMRGLVEAELMEHAGEELKHAGMLVERMIQLGGIPLIKPEDWYKHTNCGYEAPADPSVHALLVQNIKGEQCAIEVYNKLIEMTEGKDPITHKMVLEILEDEVEHEEDLEAILEDFKIMMAKK
ncbi:MAG: ferritin [Candidatus Thorarchaeota archaeon]|nr:ferritin [Candidatus Thorarchaeota archaeon]